MFQATQSTIKRLTFWLSHKFYSHYIKYMGGCMYCIPIQVAILPSISGWLWDLSLLWVHYIYFLPNRYHNHKDKLKVCRILSNSSFDDSLFINTTFCPSRCLVHLILCNWKSPLHMQMQSNLQNLLHLSEEITKEGTYINVPIKGQMS